MLLPNLLFSILTSTQYCTEPPPAFYGKHEHVYISVKFQNKLDPHIKESFRRALASWSKILDMSWTESGPLDACSLYVNLDPYLSYFDTKQSYIMALTTRPGIISFSMLDETDYEYEMTAFHELGHIFGLDHNKSKKSIMYAFDTPASTLDNSDMLNLKKLHELR